MLLVARGELDTDEAILDYQRKHLGRIGGETCLAELLPLPSPSIKEWRHSNWSELRWLSSRDYYYAHLLVPRAAELARRFKVMSPSLVIFYGTSFFRTWSWVAGATWAQAIPGKLVTFTAGHTTYFVTKHPADPALGNTRNDYFREIGDYLRRKHGERFAIDAEELCQHEAARIKATVPLMPARMHWSYATGNFMLNFSTLDLHVQDYLENNLPPEDFVRIKERPFYDRVERIKEHVSQATYAAEKTQQFAEFFRRLDPIRELRNHIARYSANRAGSGSENLGSDIVLPRDLDGSSSPDALHLEFRELTKALGELTELIEEFNKLTGGWSEAMEIGVNP
jgi:hypothetical protein